MTTLPSSLRRARAALTQAVADTGSVMPPIPAQVTGEAVVAAPVQAAALEVAPAQATAPVVAPTNVVPLNPVVYSPPTPPVPAAPTSDPRIEAMQREIAQMRQQNAELQERANAPLPEADEPDFAVSGQAPVVTEEVRNAYREAEPYVRAIATEVAMGLIKQLLPEFNAVRKQVKGTAKDLDTKFTGVAKQSFEQSINSQVPDLQALMADAQFAGYIDQGVPFMPGVTVRSVLSTAYRNQDIAPIIDAVRRFKEGRAPAAPAAVSSQPDPNAFIQPVVSGGSRAVPSEPGQAQVLTASQRAADFKAFRAGTLPKNEWDIKQAAYDRANLAGNFDATK